MRAPPLAVESAWHAEDERRAVAGEQAARRPQDDPVLNEGDDELDQRADRQADQDLGDREPEIQHCLAQQLEGQQDRRDVEPRVAEAGQQDGIVAAKEPHAPALALRQAGRRHGRITGRPIMPLLESVA